MPDSPHIFAEILNSLPKNPIAIFDLDSTLFNVSFRTQKIIDDFIADPEFQNQFPSEVNQLKSAQVDAKDWGLHETLSRTSAPVSGPFFKALKDYWQKHFFHNGYLPYDQPYPGAVDYVRALHEQGVKIHYLTGRDHQNMFHGTIASLEQHNFPLEDADRQLFMKPKKGIVEDEDFKTQLLHRIGTGSRNTWFFENEPVIINKVLADHPDINIVWIDTTHSRKQAPPKNIFTIRGEWVHKRTPI